MLNVKLLSRLATVAAFAGLLLGACNGKSLTSAATACASSIECDAGHECSGGKCVPATPCDASRLCAAGQSCSENVCRYACSTEEQCAPLGLRCELSTGLCLPKPNDLGTGGASSVTSGGTDAVASGAAGTPEANRGGAASSTGGMSNVVLPTFDVIDDLEDGDSRINEVPGRTGPWYVVTDYQGGPSSNGLLTPEADGGGKAIHFKLSADSSSWGSGVQVDLNNPGSEAKATGRAAVDASGFTGVSFRLKGTGSVRFKINTSQVVSQEEHGDCPSNCFNAYGAEIALSSAWKTYVVPFKSGDRDHLPEGQVLSLAQETGWGFETAFDPQKIMGMTLQSAKAHDLWVDDLSFFKKGGGGDVPGGSVGGGGECKDDYWPGAASGSATRYDFKQGTTLPACAYVITHTGAGVDGDWDTVEGISTGDGGYFGAINTTDYAQGAACGACVELNYQGKSVVITIVDECPIGSNPKCTKGHIDLSRKAIRQLEPNAGLEDLSGVSWRYVACPVAGNVQLRLHPNASGGWQPVIIENGVYPLQSVTLNGAAAHRSGNMAGGNAWVADGQSPPFSVHAEDVTGASLDAQFSGGASLADSGKQFACK